MFENFIGGRWRGPASGQYLVTSQHSHDVSADERRVELAESLVVRQSMMADTQTEVMCERVVPSLVAGHTLVLVLLYQEARHLPVRLLALTGALAETLPSGVLNVVTMLVEDADQAKGLGPPSGRRESTPHSAIAPPLTKTLATKT